METNTEKVKILIVDDIPENLFSLRVIIEDDDREVIEASSGNQALKLALKHDFALILSDVQMPEMDGFEMLEILRKNPKTNKVPVVFVTANSKEEQYVYKGYSEGAIDYLFKPLDATIVRAKTNIFVELYLQKSVLIKQKDELMRLNELKNNFIGMAAHDLRNPLSVVSQYSKFLLEDAEDILSTEMYEYVSVINSSSVFMSDMVNELLDITKIESGTFTLNKEKVMIDRLIDQSITINSIFSDRKGIKLESDISGDIQPLLLDFGKINQVLNNLISNAVKYSPKNTIVKVKAWKDLSYLYVSITDQGLGIPEKELANLFNPFQTSSVRATDGEKSTGLGLTIVLKLIEAHKGSIEVESQVGKGSVFTIKLPIIEAPKEVNEEIQIEDKQSISISKSKEILVCEDDLMLQMFMRKILSKYKVKVHYATDGVEGLDILRHNSGISTVLTDLQMPRMNGLELNKRIKDEGIDVEVVLLTANISTSLTESIESEGFTQCLEKPIGKLKIEELLASKD